MSLAKYKCQWKQHTPYNSASTPEYTSCIPLPPVSLTRSLPIPVGNPKSQSLEPSKSQPSLYIYTYIYVYTYIHICICMCVYIYTYIYTCFAPPVFRLCSSVWTIIHTPCTIPCVTFRLSLHLHPFGRLWRVKRDCWWCHQIHSHPSWAGLKGLLEDSELRVIA